MDAFYEAVYRLVREIPRGCVTTYGEIARALGRPHASRAVGYALHANRDATGTPCYRVVNRFGELSRGYVFGGEGVQRMMLEADGIEVKNGVVDLSRCFYSFSVPREEGGTEI